MIGLTKGFALGIALLAATSCRTPSSADQSDDAPEAVTVEGDAEVDEARSLMLAAPVATTRSQMFAQAQAIQAQMANFTNTVNTVTAHFPKATTIKSLAAQVASSQNVVTAYIAEFTQQQNDATVSNDFSGVVASLGGFHNLFTTCSNILKKTTAPRSLSRKKLKYALIEPYKSFLATGLAVDVAVKAFINLKIADADSTFQRNLSFAQLQTVIQDFNNYIAVVAPHQTSNPSWYQLGQTINFQVIGPSQSLLGGYTNQEDDTTVRGSLQAAVASGGIHTFEGIYAQYTAILKKDASVEPFKSFLLSLDAAQSAVAALQAMDAQ